jgi:putative flippase GtrA
VSAAGVRGRLRLGQELAREIHASRSVLAGQGLRFALSGGLVAVVYTGMTLLLHGALGLPFQIALVSGFLLAVALHFTLQRVFVWRNGQQFALPVHGQALRYLPMALIQYGLTALSTSVLPQLLGTPVEAVYLVTVIAVGAVNFVVFRSRIFHPAET